MKNHYRKSLLKLCIPFLMISGGDILGQTALDLAGSGNRVETTANLDVTNGFTVEYDVYMNNLINYNGLVTKGCSNVGAPLDVYVLSDGRMTVFYGNCSITGGGNPAYTFSATTWYHIAHTYDPVAGQGQLYVNGSLITTWSVGAGVGNGSVPITIGNRADGATDADAKFDNVRVWSGVRSAADILAYKGVCLTGTETGLEILYNMEEGTGTVLHDLATNNGTQDGNIIGTVAWNAGVNCAQPTAAALNFNGSTNDIIPTSVTNVPIGNSLYTIEAWIKPSSGTSSSALGIAGWGSYGSGNQVNAFRTTAQGG
ncbi:MAG TPA: LamG domain-containing protein, partial [Bacteroidia bacterium]|nr:LamG domain-containing protein [Bacteroidia bacterium]